MKFIYPSIAFLLLCCLRQAYASILDIQGVNETRELLMSQLITQSYASEGWGEETPRATTALFLAGEEDIIQDKRLTNILDLHISRALLMNSTTPLSVNELSIFVNALIAACHDPRNFYDHNLLEILEEAASAPITPNPRAILSVCAAGGKLESHIVDKLFYDIMQDTKDGFLTDQKVMSMLALSCLKNMTEDFRENDFAAYLFNQMTEDLWRQQHTDGSFGNAYSTAFITQLLISAGKMSEGEWNVSSTIQFLIANATSPTADFQIRYLVLPILNEKSLVDLKDIDCSKRKDKDGRRNDGMMEVTYSLRIGEDRYMLRNFHALIAINSSAYDVMKMAKDNDPAFKFSFLTVGGGYIYIFKMDGISNDVELGKLWVLCTMSSFPDGTLIRHDISPDKLIMQHGDHLVMWYTTSNVIQG